MVSPVGTAAMCLLGCLLLGLIFLVRLSRRGRDGLFLRQFLLLNYLVVYVVSGLTHIMGTSPERGYYDAVTGLIPGARSGLVPAALVTVVGLFALLIGMNCVAPPDPSQIHDARANRYSLAIDKRGAALAVGLGLTAVSVYSLRFLLSVTMPSVGERVISLSGGLARYAFVASWLPFGLTLLVLAVLATKPGWPADLWNCLLLSAACLAIALAASRSGGRAEAMLFAFPLLALVLPYLAKTKAPLLLLGGAAFSAYVAWASLTRTGADRLDLVPIIDWHWGRFSMIAFAETFVENSGFLGGETFRVSFLVLPLSLLHLFGYGSPDESRSIVELSGDIFTGTSDQIHIVPGMSAELFLNFGYPGVIVGYLVLGVTASWIANRFLLSRGEMSRLLFAYLGALVIFETLTAQSSAFSSYLFLSGVPALALPIVERLACRTCPASAPGQVPVPRSVF